MALFYTSEPNLTQFQDYEKPSEMIESALARGLQFYRQSARKTQNDCTDRDLFSLVQFNVLFYKQLYCILYYFENCL